MQSQAILFDLDGTLLDSLGDIAGALNHTLGAFGLPQHEVDAYREFVGEGVEQLVDRALGVHAAAHRARVLPAYRAYYREHIAVHTVPYPGVGELLATLVARGVPLCVLSNKPDDATRTLVARFFGDTPFVQVAGHKADVPRKPDPTAALAMAAVLGVDPSYCAFVGDSNIDMQTAAAAGMRGVGVSWGFRGRAELEAYGAAAVIDEPAQLLAFIRP